MSEKSLLKNSVDEKLEEEERDKASRKRRATDANGNKILKVVVLNMPFLSVI